MVHFPKMLNFSPELRLLFAGVKTLPFVLYFFLREIILKLLPKDYGQKSIRGQTVLITGAGSGIGRELAIEFAAYSVDLILVDLDRECLFETEKLLDKSSKVYLFECDVSIKEKVYAMAKVVETKIGKVDILVNNAGILIGKLFSDLTDEDIMKTINVNMMAHFWMLKAFIPAMMSSNRGHIVCIASQAGLSGYPNLTDYCASKFGVVGLMESLRFELDSLKLKGVKTTIVCPSKISTGLLEGSKDVITSLNPKDVAVRIVNGVLENRDYVILPRWSSLFLLLKWIMPSESTRRFYEESGISDNMSTFRGRTKIKINGTTEPKSITNIESLSKNGSNLISSNTPD